MLVSRCCQAWVVLPHCMQTSAGFWARVGFELGAEVDKKEAKMAVLRNAASHASLAGAPSATRCPSPEARAPVSTLRLAEAQGATPTPTPPFSSAQVRLTASRVTWRVGHTR